MQRPHWVGLGRRPHVDRVNARQAVARQTTNFQFDLPAPSTGGRHADAVAAGRNHRPASFIYKTYTSLPLGAVRGTYTAPRETSHLWLEKHRPILITFGENVTDKVSNQNLLYFSASPKKCFCATRRNRKVGNLIASFLPANRFYRRRNGR